MMNDNENQTSLLTINDPANMLIKGQSVTSYSQSCKELSRLQSAYVIFYLIFIFYFLIFILFFIF